MIQPSRRGLILGLGATLVGAPAIVRAGSLMPIKASLVPPPDNIFSVLRKLSRERYAIEVGDIYEEIKSGLEVLMPKYWERYTFAYAQMPKQWQNLFEEE